MTTLTPEDGPFRELLSFREDVFRVCLGLARNIADAEDLCQDVFLKTFARCREGCFSRFRPRSTVGSGSDNRELSLGGRPS